ncbi:MAG: universal stress protein [Asticcacaulis sp.]
MLIKIEAEYSRDGIGVTLLAQAQALKAQLLVMGAYGHSHLGEMLFGGATDHVLKHGRLPLLLAR